MDEMKSIGKKLRQARIKKGLTQEQLAGRNMHTRTLQRLEDGDGNPTLATLQELARALGTTVPALLIEPNQSLQGSGEQVLRGAVRLVQEYADGEPEQRALLLYVATGDGVYLEQMDEQTAKMIKKIVST